MLQNIVEGLKAAATVIAALSLYLAYRQLRANIRWNRVNACFTFMPESVYAEKEYQTALLLKPVAIDLYKEEEPLTSDKVTKILSDFEILRTTKTFLNLFEDYATAYKAKAIDQDLAYVLCANRFIRYFTIFQPLIKKVRHDSKNDIYWLEFETLVNAWKKRQNDEIQKAAQARLDSRVAKGYS